MSGSSISSILLEHRPRTLARLVRRGVRPEGRPDSRRTRLRRARLQRFLRDARQTRRRRRDQPQPGRMFLNVETDDARSIAQRIDTLGGNWHAPLEDRGGSLFATAIDPDGNYVQIIEFSEEARAEMESGMTDSQTT
ncbi:VOC family protein [Rhodococcus sp. 3Y1]